MDLTDLAAMIAEAHGYFGGSHGLGLGLTNSRTLRWYSDQVDPTIVEEVLRGIGALPEPEPEPAPAPEPEPAPEPTPPPAPAPDPEPETDPEPVDEPTDGADTSSESDTATEEAPATEEGASEAPVDPDSEDDADD